MKYNPDNHHRRFIRLKNFDYSQGFFFITICTQNRIPLFGEIHNGKMVLNKTGMMIQNQWQTLIQRFPQIKLNDYIIMPNHFHGIIEFVGVPFMGTLCQFHEGSQKPCNHRQTTDSQQTNNARQADDSRQYEKGQPQGIAPTVGDVVGAFKSLTTNEYIRGVKNHNWQAFDGKLWQRNYFEHIIRDEKDLERIRLYIVQNPENWETDKYNKLNKDQ